MENWFRIFKTMFTATTLKKTWRSSAPSPLRCCLVFVFFLFFCGWHLDFVPRSANGRLVLAWVQARRENTSGTGGLRNRASPCAGFQTLWETRLSLLCGHSQCQDSGDTVDSYSDAHKQTKIKTFTISCLTYSTLCVFAAARFLPPKLRPLQTLCSNLIGPTR